MLLVVIFFIIIIIAIISMQIKLYIKINKNKLNTILRIYIFKKILIGKINLSNHKRNKIKNKEITNIVNDKKTLIKFIYKIIKETSLKLEKLKLKIDVSTTDPILTSYFVMIISNIITILLKKTKLKIDYSNCKYIINPLYINEKILNIKLNCIISSNLVHITYIIYKNLKKWRCDVNGRRASNRRAYGYSNEQHKANDRC
ncbi:MAG: hypothetical protein J6A89_04845 [Clostridia bacterium]|nr:hypothetical protein [Clostridia bacterium]